MSHERHENPGHDELAARISGWLSGELDPAAARGVGHAVDRDPAARRIAAGYRRVDALVRDWYDALPMEVERSGATPLPGVGRRSGRGLSAAALAVALLVACVVRIDTVAACGWLCDAAGAALRDGDSTAIRLEPTAYWRLRGMVLKKATSVNDDGPASNLPASRPPTRS
jgi:hypothetical protein